MLPKSVSGLRGSGGAQGREEQSYVRVDRDVSGKVAIQYYVKLAIQYYFFKVYLYDIKLALRYTSIFY